MSNIGEINPIIDGTPLTYNTINDLIATVNALVRRENAETQTTTAMYVNGFGNSVSGKARIQVGQITIPENQARNDVSRKIDYESYASVPKLFFTVRRITPGADANLNANIISTDIKVNSATIVLKLPAKAPKGVVAIDWMAIGPIS
jgi:hypothetical protein